MSHFGLWGLGVPESPQNHSPSPRKTSIAARTSHFHPDLSFLSFARLSRVFVRVPDFFGDLPDLSVFPLSWPIKATTRNMPARVRDTIIRAFSEESGNPLHIPSQVTRLWAEKLCANEYESILVLRAQTVRLSSDSQAGSSTWHPTLASSRAVFLGVACCIKDSKFWNTAEDSRAPKAGHIKASRSDVIQNKGL